MTTLVALSTKDAVVLGCDSLATSTKLLVDPFELLAFFDHQKEFKLRLDETGQPVLKDFGEVVNRAMDVPYNHMTDVDKLVELAPLPMGLMFTGITSIGDRTIKSLLAEFKQKDKAFRTKPAPSNYTVSSISSRILDHLSEYYDAAFGDRDDLVKPYLEYLIAGYDKSGPLPRVIRVTVSNKKQEQCYSPGVAFAGVMQEIQRIVFGIDGPGIGALEYRYQSLLGEFAGRARELNGDDLKLPDIGDFIREGYHLFGELDPKREGSPDFRLPGFEANWGDFSDQNAIDCVAWFIGIMREAHRFSSKMPTVGGAIHIALVSRDAGFRFISREEYRHEDHRVQRVRPRPGG